MHTTITDYTHVVDVDSNLFHHYDRSFRFATIVNPSNAIEWAMAEMINQPKILNKAVEELDRV